MQKKMATPSGGKLNFSSDEQRDRRDAFKDVKPYCGDPVLSESSDRIPSLYALSAQRVIRGNVPFERCAVPTVLHRKLEMYRRSEEWLGPKILKCSLCENFYTNQEKFDRHWCEKRRHKYY